MRGVPQQNNKILLLVDGIQINELNSGGFYAGGQFNLANVERIEVVYGPASALYGTNAVSGIINVLTRDPMTTKGARATILGGSLSTGKADIRYGQYNKDTKFGYNVSIMGKMTGKADLRGVRGDSNWTNAMDNFENDVSADGQIRFKDFRAGWVIQDKDASYATFRVSAPGATGTSGTPGPLYRDHGINWHIRFLNTWLNYAYAKQEAWSLQSTVYLRDATVQDDTTPIIERQSATSPGSQSRYYRPGRLIGNETQFAWTPKERWRLSAGLVVEQERLAEGFSLSTSQAEGERPPAPRTPKMMTNNLVSAYLQAQIPVAESTELFLGIRHDGSSYYGNVQTPRFGLVFNRDKLNAKLLYGQAFRAPKPWDYTDGSGNPNLGPEKSHSVELTAAWSFSEHLRLDVALYRNHLDNLLTREIQGGNSRWVNSGELNTDGCETGLEYRKGPLRIYANYTFTASEDAHGSQVPEIARHGGNAGFQFAFSPVLRLSLRGQYFGERTNPKPIPSTGNDRIDPALVLHGTLSWKLPRGFDLQLVVNNLLDAVYYHPSNLDPSRYRQPERSLRLQVGYSF